MSTQLLAEAFNINEQLARKLQCEKDSRGNIVKVKGELQFVRPPRWTSEREEEAERERERRGNGANGLEETLCNMRLKENIGDPSSADVYTPQAGRTTAVNSLKLPILRFLRLSAERGVLHRGALMLPHWNLNAHGIMYVLRGEARVQMVDDKGRTAYDGSVRRGQVLTVPQNYAVVKRAGEEVFEWVSFKTNDNAMITPLAGRTSAMRAMPVEVIANAYEISAEDARRVKFGMPETTMSKPGQEMRADE